MSKLANQSQSSISLSSAALLITLLASLGACATTHAASARPSESFFGYVDDPADRPTGPAFFGYHQDPADQPTGPAFFGYRQDPADQPTGPSFFGYHKDTAARSAQATPPSQPRAPVTVQR